MFKFGAISFQDHVSQGITHPVFYGDLVYKLRRVKGEANFISSGSKILKRLRRRQYAQAIIERTIGFVLVPFTALYRSFLERCTLTNKAVGTLWRALSKPPQRRQCLDPRPLWLLVGTTSAVGPELAYRLCIAQPFLMDVTRYFWYTFILLYMFVLYIFMTSPILVCCWSSVSIRRIIYKFLNVCPFDYTAFVFSEKVEYLLTGLATPVWMTTVTQTDRPNSVCNRGGGFVLSIGFRIVCWYRVFCHKSESHLLLFLYIATYMSLHLIILMITW